MTNILYISNFHESVGGISGQVEILHEKFNNKDYYSEIFGTKTNNFKRIILPLLLLKKGRNFDVFHIHGCSFSGFFPIVIGVLVGTFLNKRIIISYHGGELDLFLRAYPKFVKYFLSKANQITVPSLFLQQIFNLNNMKASHLPNIIREDNVRFKHRSEIKPIIVSTRSLEKIYNISMILKAFSWIENKYEGSKLLIVGSGSLANKLKIEAKTLNIKNIEFIGRVKNSEIGKYLDMADIYVNPTTADNMPISLFEAFANGLPVISTNVGGLPNFIVDGENGLLINSNDHNALIQKIEDILTNRNLFQPLIEKGYLTFKSFTWSSLNKKYVKLYLDCED